MLPTNDNILFLGTAYIDTPTSPPRLDPEVQHLACFTGGLFALSARLFSLPSHFDLATRLTSGCIHAYRVYPQGIMPEYSKYSICPSILEPCPWNLTRWHAERLDDPDGHNSPSLPAGVTNARGPAYLLRPEAIESIFVLYRVTGREKLRDAAWEMFENIERVTATEHCNAAVDDVTVAAGKAARRDSMESFWLAETLKYFYLVLEEQGVLSLDEWVFNTEAHPFRRPTGVVGRED